MAGQFFHFFFPTRHRNWCRRIGGYSLSPCPQTLYTVNAFVCVYIYTLHIGCIATAAAAALAARDYLLIIHEFFFFFFLWRPLEPRAIRSAPLSALIRQRETNTRIDLSPFDFCRSIFFPIWLKTTQTIHIVGALFSFFFFLFLGETQCLCGAVLLSERKKS